MGKGGTGPDDRRSAGAIETGFSVGSKACASNIRAPGRMRIPRDICSFD